MINQYPKLLPHKTHNKNDNNSNIDELLKRLSKYREQSMMRVRQEFNQKSEKYIYQKGKKLLNFTSNDYLGLSQEDEIKSAFIAGVMKYGFGSCSSSLVSGYSYEQQKLEENFSEFLNTEKSVFINSGYLANISAITSLTNRNSVIFSDKLSHASILDGIALSKAKHIRYKHLDTDDLKNKVNNSSNPPNLIISESVFGMEGIVAPIDEIINIAKKNKSLVMIDDAHSIGVIGNQGRGIIEYLKLKTDDISCLITPLSKAFAGFGGMISGNKDIIETVIQFAKSYRCTTSLPQAISFAMLKSLELVKKANSRRDHLHEICTYFNNQCNKYGINISSTDIMPIKIIKLHSNELAVELQKKLIENNILVSCIRPPTVPDNEALLRISLNYHHTKSDVDNLIINTEKLLCKYKKTTIIEKESIVV